MSVVNGLSVVKVNKPLPIPKLLLQYTFVISWLAVIVLLVIVAQQYSHDVIVGFPLFVVIVNESVPVGRYL